MTDNEALQQHLHRQQRLLDAVLSFHSTFVIDEICATVAQMAAELLGMDEAFVLLADTENKHTALLVKGYHGLRALEQEHPPSIQGSFAAQILQHSDIILRENAQLPELNLDSPIPLMVALPIRNQRPRYFPVGILLLCSFQPGKMLSPDDHLLLNQLAAHAANAIENAQVYQRSESRNFELAVITDATEVVNASLSLEAVLLLIGKNLMKA
ncbi:MAG: GAF domain-containing protein [Anaerolineae bacterium]|nr:GAF domain-containing protein [Anaerolineae bacterium]